MASTLPTQEELNKLEVVELKSQLKKFGLTTKGRKGSLVKALYDALKEQAKTTSFETETDEFFACDDLSKASQVTFAVPQWLSKQLPSCAIISDPLTTKMLTNLLIGRVVRPGCTINAYTGAPLRVLACIPAHPSEGDVCVIGAETNVVLEQPRKALMDAASSSRYQQQLVHQMRLQVAGVDDAVSRLAIAFVRSLSAPQAVELAPSFGILVTGPQGSGKSAIARALSSAVSASREHDVYTEEVAVTSLFSAEEGETERALGRVLQRCRDRAPALLILDDLDSLTPPGDGAATDEQMMHHAAARMLVQFLQQSRHAHSTLGTPGVFIVATARDTLHRRLLGPSAFAQRLAMPEALDQSQRLAILKLCTVKCEHTLTPNHWQQLALSTPGFRPADLRNLACQALVQASHRGVDCSLCVTDWTEALKHVQVSQTLQSWGRFRPSPTAEVDAETDPFTHLKGMDDAIKQIRRAVILPLVRARQLASLSVSAPRGVLIHGPSGTGKTALALACAEAAKRCHANFLSVQCPTIVSKYVGASEAAMTALFEKAHSLAPAVLFLDQVEVLAPPRGADSTSEQTFDRLLSCLLTLMDGITVGSQHVVVLAATTDPRDLDPAILRPGRLGHHLHLCLPALRAREDIAEWYLKRVPLHEESTVSRLSSRLAKATEGLSGADIRSVVELAAMSALREDVSAAEVTARHVNAALEELGLMPDGANSLKS